MAAVTCDGCVVIYYQFSIHFHDGEQSLIAFYEQHRLVSRPTTCERCGNLVHFCKSGGCFVFHTLLCRKDIRNGRLKLSYYCKFPQCWRGYYKNAGATCEFHNLHFYRCPADPQRQQAWQEVCKIHDRSNWLVCENHFLEKDFMNYHRQKLNRGVVPRHLEVVPAYHIINIEDIGNGDESSDDWEVEYLHDSSSSCSIISLDIDVSSSYNVEEVMSVDNDMSSSFNVEEVTSVDFEPGLNPATLKMLQSEAWKMTERDKHCALLFDEMSLNKALYYEANKQIICGHEDLGHLGRFSKRANHALVFMLRGIHKSWKQVIAHYFTANTISSLNLQLLIRHIIGEMQKVGLKIVCTVCDQNSTNESALKALCQQNAEVTSIFHFVVNDEPVAVIFDVPHLLKNTRDALIDHAIEFEPHKLAKFEHIQQVFDLDQRNEFKLLHKLEKEHFNFKDHSMKMKVNVAAAQLSYKVAAAIETYIVAQFMPSEAMHTAKFVAKIDSLFDSLNSFEHFSHDYKAFRCAVSADTPHVKMWYSILKEMPNWKIIELSTGKDKTQIFSFIRGWQTTIKSMIFIWNRMQKMGFKYLSTKAFNQDPVENLFYCIKQHGVANTNPTCFQFKSALKTTILNKMTLEMKHQSNCEDDGCHALSNLTQFMCSDSASSQNKEGSDDNIDRVGDHTYSIDTYTIPDDDLANDRQALAYVAGYILKKIDISVAIKCDHCRSCLFPAETLERHLFKSFKKHYPQASLIMYASDKVMLLLQNIHDQLYAFLDKHGHTNGLEDHFQSVFKFPDTVAVCAEHAVHTTILRKSIPLLIYKYVRDIKHPVLEKRKSTIDHEKNVKRFHFPK